MVGLHQQGISGILADEMGLGKTPQSIAFAAHLRETGTRPFLVVCPLSVLHNWVEESKRFAPGIPVLMYHGTPAERAAKCARIFPCRRGGRAPRPTSPLWDRGRKAKTAPLRPRRAVEDGGADEDAETPARWWGCSEGGAGTKPKPKRSADDEHSEPDSEAQDALPKAEQAKAAHDAHFGAFPVVVTTYDLVIRDRAAMGGFRGGTSS
ncbi:SNF2 family N-terminal domain-containing protein [Mycena haematopus]|nr:SNF2 family N-terminal domain-containing protein [Mycena haematopus]